MEVRARNAEGDYTLDPLAGRFPPWDLPGAVPIATAKPLGLAEAVEGWWEEQQAVGLAVSTYVNYRGAFRKLAGFLGHDDAVRVTPQDVIRFKDHRLKEVSARTVKDNDLAALKSVFAWALRNRRLRSNPAEMVTLPRPKVKRKRSPGYTDDEALTILNAARSVVRYAAPKGRGRSESEKTAAAKRWVPWLLAFTGARVGEIAQLRKEDVVREGSHWSIAITPEAGTVKGGEYRSVPLHPQVIEEGFLGWVKAAPAGHLFLDPNSKTGDVLGPLQGVVNRVTEFARQHVSDRRVAPNHAWRHRFETLGRAVGMREDLQNMITGHAGANVAARVYGDPAGLYREICKLPRIGVSSRRRTAI